MTALTIRELAKWLDIGPADALDAAKTHGVTEFWHDGQGFDLDQLARYLKRDWMHDPIPELEFESTPALDDFIWRIEAEHVISEACVEIANLDGPENIVCQRLRGLLQ